MKKSIWLLCVLLALTKYTEAQRYVIRFKDKAFTPYSLSNPAAYLSQAAIDRRQRYNISLDSTDLPVTPRYLDSIRNVTGVTILNASRWLNQVSVQITAANNTAALEKINSFPFVYALTRIASRTAETTVTSSSNKFAEPLSTLSEKSTASEQSTQTTAADYYSYGLSYDQIHMHNGEFLHNIGLRGQNMIIGMLDGGFYFYTFWRAFDSVNAHGQVLGTWDFVKNEQSVIEDNAHGMYCFSTIAANFPDTMVGSAPQAKFYLFRTEDVASEYPIEEHNLVCGAERIDSSGGQVISCSLGYGPYFNESVFNHTYSQMDGNTTMAAIGADLAAKKGLLFVNSMGNEGDDPWHYLLTPADADSILVVGAVDRNRVVANFSGYGPSSDGQVKPDVASLGVQTALQSTLRPSGARNVITMANGTSYATPSLAGLVTCLWQAFPEFNNMKIIDAVRRSGNNYASPNDRTGYGIPDMKKAFVQLLKEYATASASFSNCKLTVNWTSKDIAAMKYEIERKGPADASFSKIGELFGTGTGLAIHTYQYVDSSVGIPAGTFQYRITQIVDTAAASFMADYIDTVSISKPVCTTGAMTFYQDYDRDTYGNNNVTVIATKVPAGYTNRGGDCNDKKASVYPGAPEIADNLDNDCDGQVDEGLALTAFYQDYDRDGYGNPNAKVMASVSPGPGYVTNNTDCNDKKKTVYPGAPEIADNLDNDCDGLIDEGLSLVSYYHDYDRDGYGNPNSVVQAGLYPGPGWIVRAGDCNDKKNPVHPDATEVLNGIDDNCDGSIDEGLSGISATNEAVKEAAIPAHIKVNAAPNPTSGSFTLGIWSKSNQLVHIKVLDLLGRVMEQRQNIVPNATLKMGQSYRPGMYLVEVRQGMEKEIIKLMKE